MQQGVGGVCVETNERRCTIAQPDLTMTRGDFHSEPASDNAGK